MILFLRRKIESSILAKLYISQIAVVLVPLVLLSTFAYEALSARAEQSLREAVQSQAAQISYHIRQKLSVCHDYALDIARRQHIIRFLDSSHLTDYAKILVARDDVVPMLQGITVPNRQIRMLRIIHGNPTLFDFSPHLVRLPEFGALTGMPGLAYGRVITLPLDEETLTYRLYTPIYDMRLGAVVGLVDMEISADGLIAADSFSGPGDDSYGGEGYNTRQSITITDVASGRTLYAGLPDGGTFRRVYRYDQYIPEIGWRLEIAVQAAPLDPGPVVPAAVLILLFAALNAISFFSLRAMLKRLLTLNDAMRNFQVSGDYEPFATGGGDEIGVLHRSFHHMVGRIRMLLDEVERTHKLEQEAIYRSLENQLSPHFLINALDMVRMDALTRKQDELCQTIGMIAKYYAYNIRNKGALIRFSEELDSVTNYLGICARMKDRDFRLVFESDQKEVILNSSILRFTLLPIVENAIKHGFAEKSGVGLIRVSARVKDDKLLIDIEDNGVGMSAERVQELNTRLTGHNPSCSGPGRTTGIGLANIRLRIALQYGVDYGLTVFSAERFGTLISLILPYIM